MVAKLEFFPQIDVPSSAGSDFSINQVTTECPFPIRSPPSMGLNCGPDLGVGRVAALNFIGSAGVAGDTWLAVYDDTPKNADQTIFTGIVSADHPTGTGSAFRHTAPDDPDSALGTLVGGTLSTPRPLSLRALGLQGSGEVGIVASASSAAVDSSVTNFEVISQTAHPVR